MATVHQALQAAHSPSLQQGPSMPARHPRSPGISERAAVVSGPVRLASTLVRDRDRPLARSASHWNLPLWAPQENERPESIPAWGVSADRQCTFALVRACDAILTTLSDSSSSSRFRLNLRSLLTLYQADPLLQYAILHPEGGCGPQYHHLPKSKFCSSL